MTASRVPVRAGVTPRARAKSGTIAAMTFGPGFEHGKDPAPEGVLRAVVVAAFPSVRAELRGMLEEGGGVRVVGEGTPGAVAGGDSQPDVVVAEAGDEESGIEELQETYPGTPLVLLMGRSDEIGVRRGFAGPRAYLAREATGEEIVAAVRAVVQGLTVFSPSLLSAQADADGRMERGPDALTERELEVLPLLAAGLPNKAIALRMGISEHTVKFHVGAILSKLGAASRTEAVVLAARRGLLPL
jgi:two-component system, NarL family, nitrate/nitrite response regulator NarL